MATVSVTAKVSSTDLVANQSISMSGSYDISTSASDNGTTDDRYAIGPSLMSISTDDAHSIIPGGDADDNAPLSASIPTWVYIRNTDDGNFVKIYQCTDATTEVAICKLLAGEIMLMPVYNTVDIRCHANTAVCTIEYCVFQD